eukprot:1184953-Prorocentrum_minimum.AAC.2
MPHTRWGLGDAAGPIPSDLYGKFTWKIENFSEISKRELRSNVFEVGSYKWWVPSVMPPCVNPEDRVLWKRTGHSTMTSHDKPFIPQFGYILVYPQGCDVCNHLSLFLCVADYDKLLPGAFDGVSRACYVSPSHAQTHNSSPGFTTHTEVRPARFSVRSSLACRVEPLRTVHHSGGEQGSKEVEVLRYEFTAIGSRPYYVFHFVCLPFTGNARKYFRNECTPEMIRKDGMLLTASK